MTIKTILTILTAILLITTLITAEIPQLINYQGNLTESDGTPSDGVFFIKFVIYDAATSGTEIWNSNIQEVTVTNGLFEVMLGASPMPALPDNLFSADTVRYLGIKVGSDLEISPRIKFTSTAYAYQSLRADSAGYAETANIATVASSVVADAIGTAEIADGSITAVDIDNTSVQQRVAGTANPGNYITGINEDGSVVTAPDIAGVGDITAVNAGSGLAGGGISDDVTLSVPTGGITSTHIYDNTITDSDISNSATIATTKISGTAVNLSSNQQITGLKSFGSNGPISSYQVRVEQSYNTSSNRTGIRTYVANSNTGELFGIYSQAEHTTDGLGGLPTGVVGVGKSDGSIRYGVSGEARAKTFNSTIGASYGLYGLGVDGTAAYGIFARATTDGDKRYGVVGYASPSDNNIGTGDTYGLNGTAIGGLNAYGIYAIATTATNNYAGYFSGDITVTGIINKSGASFQIDHPLDPSNKYLYHSSVESPDMMNVYNGNIVTDLNGNAVVILPDYFEVLNKDFRYQLTVIGEFAQAIIADKISGNQFTIKTDIPNVEVSWQVTGIRKDKWAEDNRIQVEVDKSNDERGLYLHPKAYGLSEEMSVDYRHIRAIKRDMADRKKR
ncbi:MAG: hypothetical protein ACE5D6_05680 [Candidatus Zixiibacteriota bacterium]